MGSASFAVIVAGGRQVRVAPGEVVQVDRLDAEPGSLVTFDQVLLCRTDSDVRIGRPILPGAAVQARVLGERRGRKIIVFKMKKRKGYRKSRGHRQWSTTLQIESIEPGS